MQIPQRQESLTPPDEINDDRNAPSGSRKKRVLSALTASIKRRNRPSESSSKGIHQTVPAAVATITEDEDIGDNTSTQKANQSQTQSWLRVDPSGAIQTSTGNET